ncbi:barstar family protein [Nocardia beijingensis]|uniref:barstar family protein n=1 Tax=Nocardia beijingensis TaxID=95162 RepID=UPI0008307148|nr:barstar family protein [Nocardia beijingensis]MBF6077133.1 barstar family protein [Nocardia beijingensis]
MTKTVTLSQFLARSDADDAPPSAGLAPPRVTFGTLAVDAADFSGVRDKAPSGYLVRELRGAKMPTTARLFDEFAAAFQFPYYFGENKDAFDECLRDLDDFLGEGAGYVAVVRDSAQLLADEPIERDWFAEAMRDCAAYWSRRDVLFRVVLQGDAPDLEDVSLRL